MKSKRPGAAVAAVVDRGLAVIVRVRTRRSHVDRGQRPRLHRAAAGPLIILIGSLIAVAPARADCDHFKWSVAREVGWFKGSPTAMPAESGQVTVGTAYALTLAKDIKLPYPPERAPGKDTYAAVVKAPKLDPGVYQITLSGEAWIDVAENDLLVKSSDFSGQRDCPGVRKTVRFNLGSGPATIQISNAATPALNFAISPSP